MTCVAADVDELPKWVSPLYEALIWCVPEAAYVTLQLAMPFVIPCAVQPGIGRPSLLNETVPPSGLGLTLAVYRTGTPTAGVALDGDNVVLVGFLVGGGVPVGGVPVGGVPVGEVTVGSVTVAIASSALVEPANTPSGDPL